LHFLPASCSFVHLVSISVSISLFFVSVLQDLVSNLVSVSVSLSYGILACGMCCIL